MLINIIANFNNLLGQKKEIMPFTGKTTDNNYFYDNQ